MTPKSGLGTPSRFCIELSEAGTEEGMVGQKDILSVLGTQVYTLEFQGHSELTPSPGPPVWTGPISGRHL